MLRTSASLALVVVACASQAGVYSVSATINGAQEVPPKDVTGTGTATGWYNDVTNELKLDISVTGLTGGMVGRHIHRGAAGATGSVIFHLMGTPVGVAKTFYESMGMDTFTFSDSDETLLLANNTYLNFHTPTYTGGEVRGQLLLTPVPEPASMTALLGGVAMVLRRRRKA